MKVLVRGGAQDDWSAAEPVSRRAETELQELLAESPHLIPVADIRDGSSPLVVAAREIGLPGSGHTDAIAVSAEGDIAIIECKLAANAEIKRKVIGQIFEYAAFLWGMSYEDLDSKFRDRRGASLTELVEEAVAGEWDAESFRSGAEEALRSGSFLLVVVVDEVNSELRRIVRYVNECGSADFSLHALEMRMFRAGGLDLLVPNLVGASSTQKPTPVRRRWTESDFFEDIATAASTSEMAIVEELYEWGQSAADRMWFGTGTKRGSVTFHYLPHGKTASVFTVFTDATFCLNFGFLVGKFADELLLEFRRRLSELPAAKGLPEDMHKWQPALRVGEAFPELADLKRFKEVVEWFRGVVHGTE